jgi:hypothetical protein
MRRLLLAVGVCAAVGVLMGLGYAALTPPPLTAKALIVLPQGAPVPGMGSHVTRLTDNVVEVSAQGSTAGQAVSADAAAVRSYLAGAAGAKLLDSVTIVPRRGGRLPALAVLGALVGVLAGALGALTGWAPYRP